VEKRKNMQESNSRFEWCVCDKCGERHLRKVSVNGNGNRNSKPSDGNEEEEILTYGNDFKGRKPPIRKDNGNGHRGRPDNASRPKQGHDHPKVKEHTGTVKWFHDKRGYGFIEPDEGEEDIFVHHSEIEGEGHRTLLENQRVVFGTKTGDKGIEAVGVKLMKDQHRKGSGRRDQKAQKASA
jgi:CspA family cold shock protein